MSPNPSSSSPAPPQPKGGTIARGNKEEEEKPPLPPPPQYSSFEYRKTKTEKHDMIEVVLGEYYEMIVLTIP